MIRKVFPKISTRGFYDLKSGKTLNNTSYEIYPKNIFKEIFQKSEIVIMIHGLRNNRSGALAKYIIAEKRLKLLNYKYDVVGFSYDSNTAGVQYRSTALSALKVGVLIAKKNGRNLSKFIKDLKSKNPSIKIRLIGHSLGSQVILSTIQSIARNSKNEGIIESVASRVDAQTRSILARAKIKNEHSEIIPGSLLEIEILYNEKNALSVPDTSVMYEGNKTFIYKIVENNVLKKL